MKKDKNKPNEYVIKSKDIEQMIKQELKKKQHVREAARKKFLSLLVGTLTLVFLTWCVYESSKILNLGYSVKHIILGLGLFFEYWLMFVGIVVLVMQVFKE